MEKMLFEFDYKDDTIYCIVDFFESFVPFTKSVYIEALYQDYPFELSLMLSLDEIQDVSFLQSKIFRSVSTHIDTTLSLSFDFKKRWNMFCESVPRVYRFEKESLFRDSKISKFNLLIKN